MMVAVGVLAVAALPLSAPAFAAPVTGTDTDSATNVASIEMLMGS